MAECKNSPETISPDKNHVCNQHGVYSYFKRVFDISAVILSSPVWLPLFTLAIIIELSSKSLGRPVFFRQNRAGKNGQIFTIFKIRTMKEGSGSDAERLTPAGEFLRKYSLDEIPQFLNVLKGDMSLIGPRPLPEKYIPLYSAEQMRRHEVSPGITGWAQVNGRNNISWKQRFEYDVWYVDHISFGLDLKILFKTIAAVLTHNGVSADGEATVKPFTGNN